LFKRRRGADLWIWLRVTLVSSVVTIGYILWKLPSTEQTSPQHGHDAASQIISPSKSLGPGYQIPFNIPSNHILAPAPHSFEKNKQESSKAPVVWNDLQRKLQEPRFALTFPEKAVLHRLQYWKDLRVDSDTLAKAFGYANKGRVQYVTCEVDVGGFNNIRMAFEHAYMTAVVTGRVLVVPPALKWYLLDWGVMGDSVDPKTGLRREVRLQTTSHVSDYWDWNSMTQVVPVITTEDFIRRERHRLQIPSYIDENRMQVEANPDPLRWNDWLRQNSFIVNWGAPHFLVWSHTNLTTAETDYLGTEMSQVNPFLKVDYVNEAQKATILHLPGGGQKQVRFLGQIASFVVVSTRTQRQMYNAALRDGLHFVPIVYEIAAKVISWLGLFRYSSLHVRRNDLQYTEMKIKAQIIMDNIETMLLTREPLYISTDELDERFFDPIRAKHPIFKWSDFFKERGGRVLENLAVPQKLVGMIEQVICAGGRTFFGTGLSTFTGLIPRLRGYIGAPDTQLRYHTDKHLAVNTHSFVDEQNSSRPTFTVHESRGGRSRTHFHDFYREWDRLWKELPPKTAQNRE